MQRSAKRRPAKKQELLTLCLSPLRRRQGRKAPLLKGRGGLLPLPAKGQRFLSAASEKGKPVYPHSCPIIKASRRLFSVKKTLKKSFFKVFSDSFF